jgi:hypothetical protein
MSRLNLIATRAVDLSDVDFTKVCANRATTFGPLAAESNASPDEPKAVPSAGFQLASFYSYGTAESWLSSGRPPERLAFVIQLHYIA